MEKITYKDELLVAFNAQVLPESDLIRGDKNLFTFSPIQDELDKFKQEIKGIYYKEQTCFSQYFLISRNKFYKNYQYIYYYFPR